MLVGWRNQLLALGQPKNSYQPYRGTTVTEQRTPVAWLKSGISGEQLAVQQLGQSDVGGVVGRQVVAQIPYPVEESEGGVSGYAETAPVVEGGPPVVDRELSRCDSAAQPTGNLRVDQVRGV